MTDPFAKSSTTTQSAVALDANASLQGDGSDYVPAIWAGNPLKWLAQTTPEYRRKRWREDQALVKEQKVAAARQAATKFTTRYAIEWGKAQGWKLIDRERYDARTKRHSDAMLGMDAIFDSPEGMVGVQGAGRYERAPHHQRFLERGGHEKAARRHIRIFYLEFERGNKTPVIEERWA